jgi:hypothetical protein
LEDIIDRYISAAPSSSPAMHRHAGYNSSPKYNKDNDTGGSLPSSPPSFTPKKIHERDTSTNSGYFSRVELFGRSSPIPTRPQLSSRALERVAERQRTSHGMPDATHTSSMSLQTPPIAQHVLAGRASLQNLHDERPGPINTPNLHPSRGSRLSASSSTRSGFSKMLQDEWEEAGTPLERSSYSGYGPGPTLNSATPFRFPNTATPIADIHNHSEPEAEAGLRKISPAEEALRSTLSNTTSHQKSLPPKSREANWTSKLFNRRKFSNASRSIAKSRISGDSISELEYVEPSLPRESPQAILRRVRDREKEPPESAGVSGPEPSGYFIGNTSYEPQVQDDHSLNDAVSDIVGHQSNEVQSAVPSNAALCSSEPSFDNGNHDGVMATDSRTSKLSFSNIKVIYDHAPLSAQHDDVVPPPAIEHVQEVSQALQQCLSMAPMKEVIELKPITGQGPYGLTFASANAIIYGCVTMAAMYFVIMNMGHSIRAYELASHMTFAGFIGLILCVVLQLGCSGQLRRVTGNMVQTLKQKCE